jgi:hypothetical protein
MRFFHSLYFVEQISKNSNFLHRKFIYKPARKVTFSGIIKTSRKQKKNKCTIKVRIVFLKVFALLF